MRAAAAVLIVALGAGVARADGDRAAADALVVEGNQLGRAGELDAAIAKFKEAFRLVPRAFYACNIGLAYVRKQEWARAHYFLGTCRSRWDVDEKRPLEKWVNERIDEATARLKAGAFAPVRVRGAPEGALVQVSAFAADERVAAGALFWLPFGRHTLTVAMAGYQDAVVEVEVADRAEKSVEVTLEAVGGETEPAAEPAAPGAAVGLTSAATPGGGGRSKLPWIVLGTGGALLAAAGVTHVIALGTKSDAEELPPGEAFEDKRDTFRTQRTVTIALYGTGLITAGLGLVMVLRASEDDDAEGEPPPVSASTDGRGGLVTFQGRW